MGETIEQAAARVKSFADWWKIAAMVVSLVITATVYAVQFQNKLVEHYQQMDTIMTYTKQSRDTGWAVCKLQHELAKRGWESCYLPAPEVLPGR